MSRRGVALASALLALLVLSLLVTTTFLTGYVEQRVARGSVHASHALEAAEAGIAMVAGEWEMLPQPGTLAVGDSVLLAPVSLSRWASCSAMVRRLTEQLYLIRSEGVRLDADGRVLARRAVALLGRSDGVTLVPLRHRSWLHMY